MPLAPTVFLLPGWLDSGPSHWQSRWEAAPDSAYPISRVQQSDWQRPLRGDWCARLDEVVANHIAALGTHLKTLSKNEQSVLYSIGLQAHLPPKTTPNGTAPSASASASVPVPVPAAAQRSIVLVAHSLGCHLVAAWAAASRHTAAIRGALLVAPPDVTRGDFPPDMVNWRKPVLQKLPFPAICVLSSNDPFGSLAAGQATAAAWGARSFVAGPLGHINGDSGLGDWPAGRALLAELIELPEPKKDTPHGH
jgi:uncharacterized protein